jgi:hypothetical protein
MDNAASSTRQKALLPDGGYIILSAPIVASKGWSSNSVCERYMTGTELFVDGGFAQG